MAPKRATADDKQKRTSTTVNSPMRTKRTTTPSAKEGGGHTRQQSLAESLQTRSPAAQRKSKRVADMEDEHKGEDPVVDDSDGDEEEGGSKRDDTDSESKAREELSRTTRNADAFRLGSSSANRKKQAALEKSILTGSYLAQAGAKSSELSRRLQQVWTLLQRMPNQHQEDESVPLERLRLVCSELMHERILEHTERNVRSLAACCFVELLRVYAPDIPFTSSEELYDAFQLIIEQIRNLAVDTSEGDLDAAKTSCDLHYFHILDSLASVKSCLLLIGVDFTVEDGEATLLVQLFKALFETIRREHSVKIESLMVAIMTACIEESDMIEQPLLDAILSPLVHSNTGANATLDAQEPSTSDSGARDPYHMAQEVIRRTSDHIQSHLSHFFNSILVDAPSGLTAHKTSDLKEHVYTLIYEVHKINPSLLLYVLPNVCMQLQVDEVATRSEAIALMGRLFASSHADYGHQYMKNFRDFLGRFRDVSKEIRLQMIQVCAIIWQRKPELGSLIEKEYILRLSDPDWEVRRLVVNELCDLAANNLELISEVCLRQMGERMKDKRVLLRKETMTGLSQVYAVHISAYWSPEEGEEDELRTHNVPTSNSKKLGWVPDFVLKCFAYPQQELKLRVVQLLDDILLPKATSEATRAKGLLFIFQALDPASKEALRRILNERVKCLQSCREFISSKKQLRQTSKGSSGLANSSGGLEKAKEKFLGGLSPLFPETTSLSKLLEQLSIWKDQSVFKHMESLCDFSKRQEDIRISRDRLIKSVGSKTPLGEFLKSLCRKLNLLTLNHSSISAFVDFFIQNGVLYAKENRGIVELLTMISKIMPEIFSPFIREEFESILLASDGDEMEKDDESDEDDDESGEKKDQRVIEGMLGVLANYSEYWKKKKQTHAGDELDKDDDSATPSKLLAKQLERYCWNPSTGSVSKQTSVLSALEVHVSKLAALSIAHFYGMAKETSSLIEKLCTKKRLASPESPRVLSTLQSLQVFTKQCGRDVATNKALVVALWSTLLESFINEEGASHLDGQPKSRKGKVTPAKLVEIRCLAIQVVVNLLFYCHIGYASTEAKERTHQVLDLLFDLLRSDGRKWTANAGFAAKYRAVAARSLLKLMRNRTIEGLVSVSQWHVLGFVMQDSSEEVRGSFLKRLTSHLMKQSVPHPHKYLSYLALAASEPSMALKKKARNLLVIAVERMRRMFAASVARGGSDGSTADAESLMVPEYSLPYVIHLLAHHPDFPKGAAERSVSLQASIFHDPLWSDQLLHLSFFLDGLVSPNAKAEADNIAFLLQMLAKLSECDDVTNPSSTHIYPLIDSAALLLKKKIKSQSNLKAFPGKIYLPKQLYATGGNKKAVTSKPASSDAADGNSSERTPFSVGELTRQRGARAMVSVSYGKTISAYPHTCIES